MGTEIVKHVDTIKEMFALETAWHELPSVRKPDDFESTLELIEGGYSSGGYVSAVLATLAVVPSTSIAFMTGFNSVGDIVATVATAIILPVGSIVTEIALEKKNRSLFGMLDTRILRRKKYRVLYEKEKQEHTDAVKVYKKKHKKVEKAKKKLLLKAERICSEAEGKMMFWNGKFESVKVQPVFSLREIELLNEFTNQLELES